MFRAYNN